MYKARMIGVALLIVTLAGMLVYFHLVFFVAPLPVLQITSFATVAALLAVAAWIGYTLATVSSPKSAEEIERELEEQLELVEAKTQRDAKSE
jgi:predicted DNA-binding transcriptional regulator